MYVVQPVSTSECNVDVLCLVYGVLSHNGFFDVEFILYTYNFNAAGELCMYVKLKVWFMRLKIKKKKPRCNESGSFSHR